VQKQLSSQAYFNIVFRSSIFSTLDCSVVAKLKATGVFPGQSLAVNKHVVRHIHVHGSCFLPDAGCQLHGNASENLAEHVRVRAWK